MDLRFEVIVLPVTDVDRAKAFYVDKVGCNLDVDHQPNDQFRVVQVTPPGSPASFTFGIGLGNTGPGPVKGMHLVVSDIEKAHAELVARGLDISDIFHFGESGQAPGIHPDRIDFGSYATFEDPDGNGFLLQEVPSRAESS